MQELKYANIYAGIIFFLTVFLKGLVKENLNIARYPTSLLNRKFV